MKGADDLGEAWRSDLCLGLTAYDWRQGNGILEQFFHDLELCVTTLGLGKRIGHISLWNDEDLRDEPAIGQLLGS